MASINSYFGKSGLALALLASCASPEKPLTVESDLSTLVQDSICNSINLQQKVGFTVDFVSDGEKLCYGVKSNDTDYYEFLRPCDKGAGKMGFARYFSGPNQGEMNMIYFLSSGGQNYLPFWRDASGNITSLFFTPVPDNAEDNFKFGTLQLDQARKNLNVCTDLIKYRGL